MKIGQFEFEEVWLVDSEFSAPPGDIPTPICLVAHELTTGTTRRMWRNELNGLKAPPYSVGVTSLFVAYYASAEIGCHLALGWPVPTYVLDLFAEFRNLTNGLQLPCGRGLLGALAWFGLDSMGAAEKSSMQQLAMRGGPWTGQEKDDLLKYCETDVQALKKLFECMLPRLDGSRSLLRGHYMTAAARIENAGIPIDIVTMESLRSCWEAIKDRLIYQVDTSYGVFDGGTFKVKKWEEYLISHDISWPRLPSGALKLDDGTFRAMAQLYPVVAPIRELRASLSQMRLAKLSVGKDGRNRCLLSAFGARTGRNTPSNTESIFGPAVWLRSLIQPPPGHGLAHIDWAQQEFGIAAALSEDPAMIAAYESGDPYLAFAKQAGQIPAYGTKETHGSVRDLFKSCVLAVQYGMGEEALAARTAQPVAKARQLLRLHHETYPKFWRWSDGAVDRAMLESRLHTVFGWTIHVGPGANPRSLRNFPMQANGAEMLRLACCYATERGIKVCAPIHDAILVEAPLDRLRDTAQAAQTAMAKASSAVLDGFQLKSDARLITYPERFGDKRGDRMWSLVMKILEEVTGIPLHRETSEPVHQCNNIVAPALTCLFILSILY